MSEISSRMGWTYPSADDDPYYDRFEDFVEGVDSSSFAHREDRSVLWAGGGTLSWTLSTETLTWTDTINVYSPLGGRLLQIAAGSIAGWGEGEVLYVSLVRQLLANASATLTKGLQVPSNDNAMALAVRIGTSIFFRTGISLDNGDSVVGVAPVVRGDATLLQGMGQNHTITSAGGSPDSEDVGRAIFDASQYNSITFRAILNSAYATTGSSSVKLYDDGSLTTPGTPRLVTTFTQTDDTLAYEVFEQVLTVVASSPGANEILGEGRVYRVVVEITATAGDTTTVNV